MGQQAIAVADADHQADIVYAFRKMAKEDNFWAALARTMAVSTTYDVRNIEIFMQNVEHRLDCELGQSTKRNTQTRLRTSVKGAEPAMAKSARNSRGAMMLASNVNQEIVQKSSDACADEVDV